jgi:hypothetical protein
LTTEVALEIPVPTTEIPLEDPVLTTEIPLEVPVPTTEIPLEVPVPTTEIPLEVPVPTIEIPLEIPVPTTEITLEVPLVLETTEIPLEVSFVKVPLETVGIPVVEVAVVSNNTNSMYNFSQLYPLSLVKTETFSLDSFVINKVSVVPNISAVIEITIYASNNKSYDRTLLIIGEDYNTWVTDDYLYTYIQKNIEYIFN